MDSIPTDHQTEESASCTNMSNNGAPADGQTNKYGDAQGHRSRLPGPYPNSVSYTHEGSAQSYDESAYQQAHPDFQSWGNAGFDNPGIILPNGPQDETTGISFGDTGYYTQEDLIGAPCTNVATGAPYPQAPFPDNMDSVESRVTTNVEQLAALTTTQPTNSGIQPFLEEHVDRLDPSTHGSIKRSHAALDLSPITSSSSQPLAKHQKQNTSPSALFSKALSEAILTAWYNDCHAQGLDPVENDGQIDALSDLLGLSPARIGQWCGKQTVAPLMNTAYATPRQAPTLAPPPQSEGRDARRRRLAITYAANARSRQCVTDVPVPTKGGKLKCTWGCSFSHHRRYEWERHEELRQPQNFWVCDICIDLKNDGKVFVTYRHDKFLAHASHHPGDRDMLATRSRVDYYAGFTKTCTFKYALDDSRCRAIFNGTWKERNDHWVKHFEEDANDENAKYSSVDKFPGGDLYLDFMDPSLRGPTSSRGASGTSGQGNDISNTESGHSAFTDPSMHFSFSAAQGLNAYQHSLYPLLLFDVSNQQLVQPTRMPKYLALSYAWTWTKPDMALDCRPDISSRDHPTSVLSTPCVLFQKAIALTAEMGYTYLWIDALCEPEASQARTSNVFANATMIIVIARCLRMDDQAWHFTCHFDDLPTVRSWVEQRVTLHHVQTLGHGAYGIVDEVQLLPARQNYARKILFRTSMQDGHASLRSQEIEVMQRLNQLDHPHIARFVAAYFDNKAINILMKPVAECDLRQFLAEPANWPGKRAEVQRWFMSLASAVECMHRASCKHKDIKPANILVSGYEVILTDFGTAMEFSTDASGSSGSALMTPKYCAPEVARQDRRGRSADIFSLGCVFAEMITVDMGFTLADLNTFIRLHAKPKLFRDTYRENLQVVHLWLGGLEYERPSTYQRKVLSLCKDMLDYEPDARPTATTVVKRLCPNVSCSGQTEHLECHCCLRRDALIRTRGFNQLYGPKLSIVLTQPEARQRSSCMRHRPRQSTAAGRVCASGGKVAGKPVRLAQVAQSLVRKRRGLSPLANTSLRVSENRGWTGPVAAVLHEELSSHCWLVDRANLFLQMAMVWLHSSWFDYTGILKPLFDYIRILKPSRLCYVVTVESRGRVSKAALIGSIIATNVGGICELDDDEDDGEYDKRKPFAVRIDRGASPYDLSVIVHYWSSLAASPRPSVGHDTSSTTAATDRSDKRILLEHQTLYEKDLA